MTQEKNDKAKEIKLLHLDHLQREYLDGMTARFLEHKQIDVKEVVESFVAYMLKLVELAAAGEKHLCDDAGNLSSSAESYLKKFTDAIFVCSKYHLHYHKILETPEIKAILAKAVQPRTRTTSQHINELEYRIKILSYTMLEKNDDKIDEYISSAEDTYMAALASMNPTTAKYTFIEHLVDMIADRDEYTISDVMEMATKYAKYLGRAVPSLEVIEELMQKYNDIAHHRDIGMVHAARVETFKILEGALMKHISNELRRYLVHQIVEYVYEQTMGDYVTPKKIEALEQGITNICKVAFGVEYAKFAEKESSKLLRATLNMGQLGLGGKVLKLLDNTQLGGGSAVSTILSELTNASFPVEKAPTDLTKNSWTSRIKAERGSAAKNKVIS